MRKLTVIRHAKSSWAEQGVKDFDRPLNNRGHRDAPLMAAHYKNRVPSVDKIISSPAFRAKTTAGYFAKEFSIGQEEIQFEEKIYEAHPDALVSIINKFDPSWNHVILFGHNPGFSYLVSLLTSDYVDKPTCSISELTLEVSNWDEVSTDTCTLSFSDYPKNHPEMQ